MTLKEKAKAYKQEKEQSYNYYVNAYNSNQTYLIQDKNSDMYHIISLSLYKDDHIQCTCFIDDQPFNHSIHSNFTDLFNFDPTIFINGYIKEVI